MRLIRRVTESDVVVGSAPASDRRTSTVRGARRGLSFVMALLAVVSLNLVFAPPASAAAPAISNSTGWLETRTIATNVNDPLRITTVVKHDATDTVVGLRLDEDWGGSDETASKVLRTPAAPNGGNCNSASMTISTVPGGSFNYSVIQFSCDPTYGINTCGNTADENLPVRIRVETSVGGPSGSSTLNTNFVRGSNDTCGVGENDMAFVTGRSQSQISAVPGQVVAIGGTADDPDGWAPFFADEFDGLRWRTRNLVTGAVSTPNITVGGLSDNAGWSFNVTAPATRGWYVVEAELRTENSYQYAPAPNGGFFWLGTITVNDGAAGNPSVVLSANDADLVVPTGQALTVSAAVTDTNGKVQIIDWDLNNNTTDGALADGFELRNYISDEPSGTLTTADLSKSINTLIPPRPPGSPHIFRARVRDNGAISGADSRAQTSTIATLTVSFKNNTATSVSCVPDPVATNATSTCTVTVTDIASGGTTEPWKPVGTVNITTSGGSLSSSACTLPGAAAQGIASNSCSVTLTAPATNVAPTIGASYGGDPRHMPSTGSGSVEVRYPTTTTLNCTPNPVETTANSTCTATVTNTTTPTGSVAFTIAGANPGAFTPTSCALVAQNATTATCSADYSSSTPAQAPFNVTATYSGAAGTHMPSAGSTAIQPKNPTTTSVVCSPNPVAISGTSTCTITVTDTTAGPTPRRPVGTVNVSASSGSLNASSCLAPGFPNAGVSTNSCIVTLTAPGVAGPVTVSASYSGANYHLPSTGDTPATVDVRDTSTTTIDCAPNPIGTEGATAVCTATVTSVISPSGTVAFPAIVNATIDPSCTLTAVTANNSTCSVNFTSTTRAAYTVVGNYSGAPGIMPSTGSTTMNVSYTTTLTVTCSPNLMKQGYTSTCNILAQGGFSAPTGSVLTSTDPSSTVDAGCVLVATGAVRSECTVTFTSSAIGVHTITAQYAGDAGHGARTGTGTVQVDAPHVTATTVSCPTPATVSVFVTCTATVTDTAGNPVTPTGTVTFTDSNPTGDQYVPASGICTLNASGVCTVSFRSSSLGTHPLTGTYSGNAVLHAGSASTPFNVVVQNRTTNTSIVCTPLVVSGAGTASCTATVSDSAVGGFAAWPQGSVTFNATGPGTGTFTPGTGTCALVRIGLTTTSSCTVLFNGTVPSGTSAAYGIGASYTPSVSPHLGSTATGTTVTFAVTPTAVGDSYSTLESTTLNVSAPGVLGNDTGASLVVTSNTAASNGLVTQNADGSFTYVPTPAYTGPDSFTYTFTDLAGQTRTATVNITVVAQSIVSGTVTDTVSLAGLPGMTVNVRLADGTLVSSTSTIAGGAWSITGIADGTYRVEFVDPNGTHINEWWNNQATLAASTPVAIAAGTVASNINAALVPVGVLRGTITDQTTGLPLSGMRVDIYRANGTLVATTFSDGSGLWVVGGLQTFKYVIRYSDPTLVHATEYWNNGTSFYNAKIIALTAGTTYVADSALL